MPETPRKPLRFPASRDKLINRSIAADDTSVSVGGLAARLGLLSDAATTDARRTGAEYSVGVEAVARLVQLARRDRGLSPQEFAVQFGISLDDALGLESARAAPEPRVLHQLSLGLKVSYKKLMTLAGHRIRRDEGLKQQAVRFAANSRPMDTLTKAEAEALHEFIRALHD